MNLLKEKIDNNWTLFLDRDGVINRRIPGDYVKRWEDFVFLPGVMEALAIFSDFFGTIIVVTNQQGIGKGLMTTGQLDTIHEKMVESVRRAGGRIDKVYHCPDLEDSGSLYRKPNIGMALQARKDFPGLSLGRSVMAGDSLSDMQFGRRAAMVTALIAESPDIARQFPAFVDHHFTSLHHLALSLSR